MASSGADSVLIVDDDVELCEMLSSYLGSHGWSVSTAHSGEAGLASAASLMPHLVIVDVMLPDMDGFEVLRRLHKAHSHRVLLLTARGEEIDRIVGLELGADDYLGKPFNPRELMARMKAILRRSQATAEKTASSTEVSGFSVDSLKRAISFRQRLVPLTDAEFMLLQFFLERAHEVISRDELSLTVFERASRPFDRTVDMTVSRLRRKLEQLAGFHGGIRSVRNSGYIFVPEGDGGER
ncbi:response regulator transcription factor [Granulicella cerasi]|uniref:Response regulator transcription factor n=1 Tax=Granulicella cerasi TaxID=741063 RepID=A0ABW1Z8D7_9BACT|nr:response regulator transcription factor [Granulicella cerasi]